MSAHWAIISFVVGTFFSTIGWIVLIRTGHDNRRGWIRGLLLSQKTRRCKSLFWKNIHPGPLVSRDACSACALGLEHERNTLSISDHDHASHCTNQTLHEVFSSTELQTTPFPSALDDPDRYLCVDLKVLLAFIVSVIPHTSDEIMGNEAPGDVFDRSVVQLWEEEGYLIAHLIGTHRRYLTLEDCDGLIRGFPPWYRRTIKLNHPDGNLVLDHPCFQNSRNCARAGWVIAVAVTNVDPIPAYFENSVIVHGQQRGRVLRAGCERALVILKRLRRLEIQASNLPAAIAEISRLLDDGPSMGSHVPIPNGRAIPAHNWRDLVRIAIELFDTEPHKGVSPEARRALDESAELIVYWASYGVWKILQYWKHPGREISWDERLKPGRQIYLQDCRLPLH